jgi:hypothetical protein
MFRKITLAVLAVASLSAAAPSIASAHGMGGHGGMHGGRYGGIYPKGNFGYHGWHVGYRHRYGSNFTIGGSCYKTVFTEFGPRRVNVCGEIF